MLGRLSPHHDDNSGSGSNQSSETAPSYSQLNYRENIERLELIPPGEFCCITKITTDI